MQTYIVQPGDTLYGISRQFGVSVNDIMLQNNLTNTNIVVGDKLYIPSVGSDILYVVKKGDTLYSISSKYNVSVASLMKENNLTTTNLSIGQQLKIPVANTDSSFSYYVVVAGDSLYSIANKFKTSVDAIKKLNGLTSNLLSVGQRLKIPSSVSNGGSASDYIFYVVRKGDSLYSIANKFGMTVDSLKALNNLTSNTLNVGQVLKINQNYNGGIPEGASCYGEGYVETQYVTYVVKPGDNLYNIARLYKTSVDNIRYLNNLKNNNLTVGQVLKIKEAN